MKLIKFKVENDEIFINIDSINAIYKGDISCSTIDCNGYKYYISEPIEEIIKKIKESGN